MAYIPTCCKNQCRKTGEDTKDENGYPYIYCRLTKELCIAQRWCPEHFAFHIPIIDYVRGNIDKATAKSDLEQAIKKYGDVKFSEDVSSIVAEILGTKTELVKADSENKSKK